ncbi:MAG TPA: hypothetical protein VGO55_13825 [Allosphingosinicella sp.]|jgi:hypothetical protein|nr:hypothetical protein [Allosphingosinicella sp.]
MDDPERPVTRETTVINTGERRGGGTVIAIMLVLIVATLGFLYFGGYLQRAVDKADVNINVSPKIDLPDINVERPKSEAPAGNSAK